MTKAEKRWQKVLDQRGVSRTDQKQYQMLSHKNAEFCIFSALCEAFSSESFHWVGFDEQFVIARNPSFRRTVMQIKPYTS